MKKIFTFFAAALMSVSVFAAKDVVPSDDVLSDYYYPGDVCLCFFVPADINCNDIVVTGSFNDFSTNIDECLQVEVVEGYDGWYVTSFEPEAEPDAKKGIQATLIMRDPFGNFDSNYKLVAATAIRGGVQVAQGASAGEVNLINLGTDAPNVFTVDAWKVNPCTAIYHNYTITVVSKGCDGNVVPFLVGHMTDWEFEEMQFDAGASIENNAEIYSINILAAEEIPYQIVSGLRSETTGEIEVSPAMEDDAYLLKYVNGEWVRYPGEDGYNILTHEEASIVYDLRAENLRWARCDDESMMYSCVAIDKVLPTKLLRNGQILILRGDKTYTLTGQEIK